MLHNTRHMPRRLIIAFTLSLVLHGGLLLAVAPEVSVPPPAPRLHAALQLPPDLEKVPEPPPVAETLLKNTIEDERPAKAAPDPVPPPPKDIRKAPAPAAIAKRKMEAVRKKLSAYVFYPEQARRLGVEGTVELYVELADDGRVEDVRVVTSSGFPILDNAAVKGFYAVGRLPGKSRTWHYTFQLE